MYALVDILGKQYKVEQGSVLKVDHVVQEKGSAVEFPSVLLVSDGEKAQIGSPYLSGVTMRAIVEDHGRERKLVFGKYKKKKNYRRRYGHRQQYSLIKVEGFTGIAGMAPSAPAREQAAPAGEQAAPAPARGPAPAAGAGEKRAAGQQHARAAAPKPKATGAAGKRPAGKGAEAKDPATKKSPRK